MKNWRKITRYNILDESLKTLRITSDYGGWKWSCRSLIFFIWLYFDTIDSIYINTIKTTI